MSAAQLNKRSLRVGTSASAAKIFIGERKLAFIFAIKMEWYLPIFWKKNPSEPSFLKIKEILPTKACLFDSKWYDRAQ